MPIKRVIPKMRRREAELSHALIRVFAKGRWYFGDYWRDGRPDMPAIQAAWELHGEDFMVGWIQRHPGYRPAAWWWFSSPEKMRRQLGGGPQCHDGNSPQDDHSLHGCLIINGACHCSDKANLNNPPIIESELDYLIRHDLLEPGELEENDRLGTLARPNQLRIAPPICPECGVVSGEHKADRIIWRYCDTHMLRWIAGAAALDDVTQVPPGFFDHYLEAKGR